MQQFGIPRRNLSEAHIGQTPWNKGKECPQLKGHPPTYLNKPNLDDELTLAYVLGVVEGDGCLYDDGDGEYIILLQVKDEHFAKSFYDALKKIGLKPTLSYKEPPSWKNGKFCVRAWSKLLFEWLKERYSELDSWLNNDELFKAYLRGFYESEGCLYKQHIWNRGRKYEYYALSLSNTNKNIIDLITRKLQKLGFHPKVYEWKVESLKHKMAYSLRLHKQEEIKRCLEMIKPCIKIKSRGELSYVC